MSEKKVRKKFKVRKDGKVLRKIYGLLYRRFGSQNWWPADSPLEVIVGAILTQNTGWKNVEAAITNLKAERILNVRGLKETGTAGLARVIRPAGYFNVKARRLKNFIDFLIKEYNGSLKKMFREETGRLREKLLAVKGIGPETADSILLYAAERPVFVVDAYTGRMLQRHGLIRPRARYDEIRNFFQSSLAPDAGMFNEYHALIVKLGKTFCRRVPRCGGCPLEAVGTLRYFHEGFTDKR